MSKLKWIIILLISLVIMSLGFWINSENDQLVQPVLLGYPLSQFSLGAWLFAMLLVGGIVGFLISWVSYRLRQARMEHRLGKKDREIAQLRGTMVKS